MEYLAGSIQVKGDPHENSTWVLFTKYFAPFDGTCAYRIPLLGEKSPKDIPAFCIVSSSHGVVLVDVVSELITDADEDFDSWITSDGEDIFARDLSLEFYCDEIAKRFKKSRLLYDRRKSEDLVPIHKILAFKSNNRESLDDIPLSAEVKVLSQENHEEDLVEFLKSIEGSWDCGEENLNAALSLIEGTYDMAPRKRLIRHPSTMQEYIQQSQQRVFMQDKEQRQISMQIPDGVQRIRGLAGTGKTIVLCLKAALAAITSEDYRILFLFNTQSLYHLVERTISEYYARESKSAVDWDTVHVLHAWGGKAREGLYSKTCDDYGIRKLTFNDVRGQSDALAAIYRDLNVKIGSQVQPIYDLVLIDEAQDFPTEVFNFVWKLTKEPKRIVVAYDDFQSLTSLKARTPEELFGTNEEGECLVSSAQLEGEYAGGIAKDFVLPNSYRNPRINLLVAHGVALGIYRKKGLIDSVDRVSDWEALGYKVESPEGPTIRAGDQVVVSRPEANSKNDLERLITEQEKADKLVNLIQVQKYEDEADQLNNVANTIARLIKEQGVPPEEIVVITLDTRASESCLSQLRGLLDLRGIKSISPGFVEQPSKFKEIDRITLTTAFKAKGNEASIVFVLNSQLVANDSTFRQRNAFFVSVTRSRGWCYISGYGNRMNDLQEEIQSIIADQPFFKFVRPDDEAINQRRFILAAQEDNKLRETMKALEELKDSDPEKYRQLLLVLGDDPAGEGH